MPKGKQSFQKGHKINLGRMKIVVEPGKRYNKLTAIRFIRRNEQGSQCWLFHCDCGNEKVIMASDVKRGKIRSCGCLRRSKMHEIINTPVYKVWENMKSRCLNTNKNSDDYKRYRGRGIKICKQWMEFKNFYADMGKKPKGLTLERIDNNGDYCKENCRWATKREQANNTRRNRLITYNSKTKTVAQWARVAGVKYTTFWVRLYKLNWSLKRALNEKT